MPGGLRALCALLDANNDGELTKDELVSAHDGDFGLFEAMHPTIDGSRVYVTESQFKRHMLHLITEEASLLFALESKSQCPLRR